MCGVLVWYVVCVSICMTCTCKYVLVVSSSVSSTLQIRKVESRVYTTAILTFQIKKKGSKELTVRVYSHLHCISVLLDSETRRLIDADSNSVQQSPLYKECNTMCFVSKVRMRKMASVRTVYVDSQPAKTATLGSLQTKGLKGATTTKAMSFCA